MGRRAEIVPSPRKYKARVMRGNLVKLCKLKSFLGLIDKLFDYFNLVQMLSNLMNRRVQKLFFLEVLVANLFSS
jgi:hypothetical protein